MDIFHYAAGIFNFSHNFHWSPSKLCDNIGYNGKSEGLLEYCNEKLPSSTRENHILFKTFKNILVDCIFSSSRHQGPWASCYSSVELGLFGHIFWTHFLYNVYTFLLSLKIFHIFFLGGEGGGIVVMK